jgi:DNA-binding NarL/FixJ family response regulator
MIRVVIADDHEIVRRGLRVLLETRRDFVVCAEAADGRAAVALAIEHKPDVVVLDVSLPLLSGVEATRRIRKGSPDTEVLIYTMHDGEALIGELFDAGARGYLPKSDGDESIVEAVSALARRRPFIAGNAPAFILDRFRAGAIAADGQLTAREREVVQLLADGQSNKEVAIALRISVKTIEAHRSAVMRKLGIHSTAQLVRYAIRNKLIQA